MVDALVYIFSALITYIMGFVSKKFHWNNALPIPVQNIFVGILVFVVIYFLKKPCDLDLIIEQIQYSIFAGVGTATLVYDATKKDK